MERVARRMSVLECRMGYCERACEVHERLQLVE